jgi:hypothetical protein
MTFTSPIWNAQTNSYKVRVIDTTQFLYTETRVKSSGNSFYDHVNVNDRTFNKTAVNNLANAVWREGASWFATPINPEVFLKKVTHSFADIPIHASDNYGKIVEFTWVPYEIIISSKSFKVSWELYKYINHDSIIPSDFIDFSEELELSPRTIVIQQNDIIENAEIPFDNSEQDIHQISSRAILKQKVRKAKLKAAIATMKAERMAEKYFRRYGVQTNLDSDSDISFDSENEESEEEI